MTVIDLIIKLKQLPPNMDVMIDVTPKESSMFKFSEINSCDQITTSLNQEVVVISNAFFEDTED